MLVLVVLPLLVAADDLAAAAAFDVSAPPHTGCPSAFLTFDQTLQLKYRHTIYYISTNPLLHFNCLGSLNTTRKDTV